MNRIFFSIALLALLFGCAQPAAPGAGLAGGNGDASQGGDDGTADIVVVHISDFKFDPSEITIRQGQAVRWVNDDSASHTVKSEGYFESPAMQKGGTFEHMFNEAPGEYAYRCGIHPSMQGKVIVTK